MTTENNIQQESSSESEQHDSSNQWSYQQQQQQQQQSSPKHLQLTNNKMNQDNRMKAKIKKNKKNKRIKFIKEINSRSSSNSKLNFNLLTEEQLRQKQLDREEMQSLLLKLKQLVPGIPKNRRLTQLDIIQHVIDYIFDLQMALEHHPIASTMAANVIPMAVNDFHINNINNNNLSINHNHNHHQQQQQQQQQQLQLINNTSCQSRINSSLCDHHHHHPRRHQLPQRIPGGSNRQPLASIIL